MASSPVIPVHDGLHEFNQPGLKVSHPSAVGMDSTQLDIAFRLLAQSVSAGETPGAAAVVLRRGRVVACRAYGWAQTEPERRTLQPDTLFDLASLTKVMATLPVILLLIDQGALRLDDPVSLFLPGFADEGKRSVTIRHLLIHTSGLAAVPQGQAGSGGRAERVADMVTSPLQQPPGTKVVYSDIGYILLGEIAAAVTGQPLEQLVRERIMRPLGLASACFCPPPAAWTETAATEGKCGQVHDERAAALDGVAGHAGLFGTAPEVAAYGQFWLSGKTYGGEQLLSPAVMALATRDLTPTHPEARGLGWQLYRADSTHLSCGDLFSPGSFGHTGFTGTSLWVDPDRQVVIALLTNRVHLGRTATQPAIIRLRARFHNAVAAAVST